MFFCDFVNLIPCGRYFSIGPRPSSLARWNDQSQRLVSTKNGARITRRRRLQLKGEMHGHGGGWATSERRVDIRRARWVGRVGTRRGSTPTVRTEFDILHSLRTGESTANRAGILVPGKTEMLARRQLDLGRRFSSARASGQNGSCISSSPTNCWLWLVRGRREHLDAAPEGGITCLILGTADARHLYVIPSFTLSATGLRSVLRCARLPGPCALCGQASTVAPCCPPSRVNLLRRPRRFCWPALRWKARGRWAGLRVPCSSRRSGF